MSNADWLARSLRAVWHPCTQMQQHETLPLVPIARAEGVWLYDFEGRRYLDAISSWWVNLLGHGHPRINEALTDQLGRLEHVMLAGLTHGPVIELSERLAQLAPRGLGHCFYGSDGASATEIALKMSFHYWHNRGRPGKTGFISLANGYHGETIGALSVTDVALFKATYAPLLRPTHQLPSPDWRLAEPGESPEAYALRCADALETYLARHHARTAALILEPLVQCAAGMGMYHPVYLRRAREICDRYEVHLIADEIAVGFGRTGTMFAWEQAFPPADTAGAVKPEAAAPPRPRASPAASGPSASTATGTMSAGEQALPPADGFGRTGTPPSFGGAGIAPDFLCLSKGITGGYLPLSVVLTTDEIYDAFYAPELRRGFLHSHSYTGNALACRAALATLQTLEAEGIIAANRAKAREFEPLLAPLRSHGRVRQFRHLGMIWAFEVADAGPDFPRRFFAAALERGLLLRPIGNTVYFMPPYAIDGAAFAHLVDGTLHCLDHV